MKKSHQLAGLLACTGLLATFGTIDQEVLANESTPKTETVTETVETVTTSQPTTVAEAQAQVDQASTAVAEAGQTLDETKTAVETASAEKAEAEKAVTENEVTITEATTTIDEVSKEIPTVEQAVEVSSQEVSELETKVDELEAENPEAAVKLETAENTVETAKQADDKAKTDVETAEMAVEAAESALKTAEQDKATLETKVSEAKTKETSTKSALEVAETNATKAEQAVADKTSEVDAKRAELQTAVTEAGKATVVETRKVDTGVTAEGLQVSTNAIKRVTSDPDFKLETPIFSGNQTVDVALSAEQTKEFKETGKFTYVPNVRKIAEHMVDYINQLRELNGIPEKLVLDENMMTYAQARANEMLANDKLSHTTKLTGKMGNENISKNSLTYTSGPNIAVISDKQFAYENVFAYFSEYTSLTPGYGHRIPMLFANGGFGFGYADKSVTPTSKFKDSYSTQQFNQKMYDKKMVESYWGNVTTKVEDGKTIMYFKGERLKFLPKFKFNYVMTEDVRVENKAYNEAVKVLETYENSVAQELTTLRTAAQTANTKLAEAKQAHTAAKTELENLLAKGDGQAAIDVAKVKLTTAKANFADAKVKAEKTAKELTKATTELTTIQNQFKTLTEAKAELETAKAKLQENKTKLVKLETTKRDAEAKLEKALVNKDSLLKTLEEKSQALTDAETAHEDAKVAYGEAQARFLVAQGNLMALQDAEVKNDQNQGHSGSTTGSAADAVNTVKQTKATVSHQLATGVNSATTNKAVVPLSTEETPAVGQAYVAAKLSKRHLPETGESHLGLLTALGMGLVLCSLGLALRRRSRS